MSTSPRHTYQLLAPLLKHFRFALAGALGASVISGAGGVALLALINNSLSSPAQNQLARAGLFALVCIVAIAAKAGAGVLFARISQQTLALLRKQLAQRIANAPLRTVETLGAERAQTAATEDAANVAFSLVSLPNVVMNAVVVLGCLGYLAWLSWPVALLAAAVLMLGSVGYHIGHGRALADLRAAGVAQDRLFADFGALFIGAKELKLNRARHQLFLGGSIGAGIDRIALHKSHGLSVYALASSWGMLLIYSYIGAMALSVGVLSLISASEAASYTIVFLYLLLPLDTLLNNLPTLGQARVAIERIDALLSELIAEPAHMPAHEVMRTQTLTLHGISHRYYHEREDRIFQLGPIDLQCRAGQITFVVGGNGSGKTTLAKLLTGLYTPENGYVALNGQSTGPSLLREQFSSVFSDFYLFDSLLGTNDSTLDAPANALAEKLQIAHKVKVENGSFSTRALSQGQRKRLALIVAYLEDRPIYVFDEWAADQDPLFKEVFYRELLPALAANGKIIIAITHDDRYFDVADQLIKLENGQIIELKDHTKPGRAQTGLHSFSND